MAPDQSTPVEAGGLRKLRLLVCVDYFPPGHRGGGALRATWNFVNRFASEWQITVLTRNHDLGESGPYREVQIREVDLCPAEIVYIPPGLIGMLRMLGVLKRGGWDLLYVNSLFSGQFSILPCLYMRCWAEVPILVAPRGELLPPALRRKKWKKCLYIFFAKGASLYRTARWHATSEDERRSILDQKLAMSGAISVAADLPSKILPPKRRSIRKVPGELAVLFVGRIHPHKGLHKALEWLEKVNGLVRITILGPEVDLGYAEYCREIAKRLPSSILVEWVGARPHEQVLEAYRNAHLHILPTESENHGYTIQESLLLGTPVLTSTATPWSFALNIGGGEAIPIEEGSRWVEALERFIQMGQAEFELVSAKAYEAGTRGPSKINPIEATRMMVIEASSRKSSN